MSVQFIVLCISLCCLSKVKQPSLTNPILYYFQSEKGFVENGDVFL